MSRQPVSLRGCQEEKTGGEKRNKTMKGRHTTERTALQRVTSQSVRGIMLRKERRKGKTKQNMLF